MNSVTKNIWSKCLIKPTSKIKEAVRSLSKSSLQICLVVSRNNTLIGTITDGDVRRGLLRGLNLEDPITTLIKKNPFVVTSSMSNNTVQYFMRSKSLLQVPQVNEKFKVTGLYLLSDFKLLKKRKNLVVIMAGGFGKRLRPYTLKCPKPMLTVAGAPILEHIINNISSQGFSKIVISTHYLGSMIKDYFKNGKNFNVDIDYINESKPMGTAGALSLMKKIPNEPLVVVNGDILTEINYGDLIDYHQKNASQATMAVKFFDLKNPYGVVKTKGIQIIDFEEKPVQKSTIINAGVYVLNPATIKALKKKKLDMPDFFKTIKKKGKKTIVFPIYENWSEIGSFQDYDPIKKRERK